MKSFFRYIISGLPHLDTLLSQGSNPRDINYLIQIICSAYSMPKTATVILAFISNPTTKKEDIAALCEQISLVYAGNSKAAIGVSNAVKAIYEACIQEEIARKVYSHIEEIASMHKLNLSEPLFKDMQNCKENPTSCQEKRLTCRNALAETANS
jgi:hypothetical protein